MPGSFLPEIERILEEFPTDIPIICFSSMASFVSVFRHESKKNIALLAKFFSSMGSHRDVLMPTFPRAAGRNSVDLDLARSTNGALTESFRLLHPSQRTLSAVFPFSFHGPSAELLGKLTPAHAWGDGSVYDWAEQRDALILTIGLPRYVCSVQHRAEYLESKLVRYRYFKTIQSELKVNGLRFNLQETLFVRRKGVNVDFSPMSALLESSSQVVREVQGVSVSAIRAREKLNLAREAIRRNPQVFVLGAPTKLEE